jgi:hypothetical protein
VLCVFSGRLKNEKERKWEIKNEKKKEKKEKERKTRKEKRKRKKEKKQESGTNKDCGTNENEQWNECTHLLFQVDQVSD